MMKFDITANTILNQPNPSAPVYNDFQIQAGTAMWSSPSPLNTANPAIETLALIESNSGDGQIFISVSLRQQTENTTTSDQNLTRLDLGSRIIGDCVQFATTVSITPQERVAVLDAAGSYVDMMSFEYVTQNLQGVQYRKRIMGRTNGALSISVAYSCQASAWEEVVWQEIANKLRLNVAYAEADLTLDSTQQYDLPDTIPLDKLAYVVVVSPVEEWKNSLLAQFQGWSPGVKTQGTVTDLNFGRGAENVSLQVNFLEGGEPDPSSPTNEHLTHLAYDTALQQETTQRNALPPVPVKTLNGQMVWMLQTEAPQLPQKNGFFGGSTMLHEKSVYFSCLNLGLRLSYRAPQEQWSQTTWGTCLANLQLMAIFALHEM